MCSASVVYAYSLFAALNRISAPAPLPCMSTTPLPNHLPVHINLGNAVVAASATAPSIRVVAISDTHSLTHLIPVEDIPLGDVLVHCGDFTKRGKAEEISKFDAWRLPSTPHKAGNQWYASLRLDPYTTMVIGLPSLLGPRHTRIQLLSSTALVLMHPQPTLPMLVPTSLDWSYI